MIAIISDIHANYPALLSVINDIEKRGIKRIISLGDVCGYHTMINESIELLREKKVINIRGNHDHYMIENIKKTRSNVVNKTIAYQRKIIKKENLLWLEKSIWFYKDNLSYMVHGSFEKNGTDKYLYEINKKFFSTYKQKFFFAGHTHVQIFVEMDNRKFFCNPGSVGQPRDGDNRTGYAIFYEKEKRIELVRCEYDIDMIAWHMKNEGFDEPLYKNLYYGLPIDGKIKKIDIYM